nr:reverse transcriptase domain-containing protein [Tanacetum cinerariifolium]
MTVNGGKPPVNHRELPPDHCSFAVGEPSYHRSTVVDPHISFVDRKRVPADANLLCQPSLASFGNKLVLILVHASRRETRRGWPDFRGASRRSNPRSMYPVHRQLIISNPKGVEITYALRFEFEASNNEADFAHLTKQVLVEVPKEKSIEEKEILVVVEEEGYSWTTPLFEYLSDGTLPADTKEARAIKIKASQYAVINDVVYKKSFLEPWLWCVGPLQDARNIIRKCDDCRVHQPVPKNPQQKLTPITSPWAFFKCGIDISGLFLEAQRKMKFLILAIDYFTKWIEAKPVATITGNQVNKCVWDNIVCRFGLPGEIIYDNEKQSRDNPFKDWFEKLNIKQRSTSIKHLQINEQEERANRSLGEGIKAKLGEGMPSLRCVEVNQAENDEGLLLNLDILEERREKASVHEARSKAKMERYYKDKVRCITFRPGDFVYRNNEASYVKESGKLCPKWEGHYKVVEALGKGASKLKNGRGDILPLTWNVKDLKKWYL